MKQKINFAQISRTVWWLGLIFCVGLTAARAQVPVGTVIPRVCFETKPETFTRTLTANEPIGQAFFTLNQATPDGFYRMVVNPGGATQENFLYARISGVTMRLGDIDLPAQSLANAHAAGETVLLTTDGEAVFGYNNTTAAAVTIARGVAPGNYFAPGALVYPAQQPTVFQPGAHENLVRVRVISDLRSNSGNMTVPTWYLNGSQATSTANAGQGCATITYQGRLSDAGSAANGQFDLQFQAFETVTGGIAQSVFITLDNVQVTNGIFTVPLYFGATLTDNYKAQFLEIGVRPGTSTGAFTVLTPRQPITSVPYAINAQTAQTAATATNSTNATNVSGGFVQFPLTTNAPPASECNAASQYGRQKVDATNNKLWICTATGWKSTALQ